MGDTRKDETGNVYGKLTVREFSHIKHYPSGGKQTYWICECTCNNRLPVRAGDLRRSDAKAVRSCGECCRIKHGHSPAGNASPEYVSWHSMITRCHTESHDGYEQYGAAGLTVCERWRHSFTAFLEDMGKKPDPTYTIDRMDGDKGYEPGNCRWASKAEQSRNMRTNVWVTIGGETMILKDWWLRLQLSPTTYYSRRKRGLSIAQALGVS